MKSCRLMADVYHHVDCYTVRSQKNGAVSNVNKRSILETGPALSLRSKLLVAHEKLGQLPLLTVYV
jgi:hypothetical protein